ncbi:hypothetical protein EPIB1_722 [Tritonibacter mobilis]|nr:hypothetical protein EPIB1_722 [Tritonibacter mobilis]
MTGIAQLHRDREIQARRPPSQACNAHLILIPNSVIDGRRFCASQNNFKLEISIFKVLTVTPRQTPSDTRPSPCRLMRCFYYK